MKKLLKKNRPTQAEYFKSESQRKKTSRLAFFYGHKPLVAIVSVLIVASAITGLVIVQKSRDSSAATVTQRAGVSFNKGDAPVAIANWTGTNTSNNAALTTFAKSNDELTAGFKAGGPGRFEYGTGYRVCWNLALGASAANPGLVYHNVRFTYRTNEAGTNGMAVYLNGQQVGLSEDKKLNGNPNTPHEGGGLFDKTIVAELGNASPGSTVSFCNVKIGGNTAYFTADRYITVYAYTFGASYDQPINQYEILGTVTDNSGSHKPIAGVTISNCQTTTTTDANGMFRFWVNQGSYFCVRTQGGLNPNTYTSVKAINENKGAINVGRSADGSSYENQQATARGTNYDFWAVLNPALATPATPCTNTGNGNPVQVEAENASCKNGGALVTDETGQSGKAAGLKAANASVQYTFTAPSKGLYQAVARIRNTSSTDGKAYMEFKKLNPGAASDTVSQSGKVIGGTTYANYTIKDSGGTVQTQCLEGNQQALITVTSQGGGPFYVDTLSLVRSGDCPAAPVNTGNTGNSGGNVGSANPQTSYNTQCRTDGSGLPTPVAATEGIKSGSAINTTLQGKKAVFLQKDGDYVECMVTLPAGAEAGGYVLAFSGTASVGPGQSVNGTGSPSGDYNGTSIKLSMAGNNVTTAPYTKGVQIAGNGTFAFDRAPIVRKTTSDKPTVRFIRPGEKVVVRATLVRPTANNGQLYIENLQLYKDPCTDSSGNVIQDGRDVGGGVKCEPPKAPTPTPANPAPAANSGSAADAAAAVAAAAKCSNNATGERQVEAEKAVCAPNTSNPATVVTQNGVKAVALRNDGQYVEYSFKNNKAAGKYRAASIIKAAGTEAYVIYDLVKERPGAIDTTTAEARNISQSFAASSMSQQAKYQDLTKEEIAQGVTLKVRVTYKRKTTTTGSEKTTVYVDKVGIERVGDVTPVPAAPKITPSTTSTRGTNPSPTPSPSSSPSPSPSSPTPSPAPRSSGSGTDFTADRVRRMITTTTQTIARSVQTISRPSTERTTYCANIAYNWLKKAQGKNPNGNYRDSYYAIFNNCKNG